MFIRKLGESLKPRPFYWDRTRGESGWYVMTLEGLRYLGKSKIEAEAAVGE